MYNRKPHARKEGRYETKLPGIREYAEEVAKELAEMYPTTDIIDIKAMFEIEFNFAMTMEMAHAIEEGNANGRELVS